MNVKQAIKNVQANTVIPMSHLHLMRIKHKDPHRLSSISPQTICSTQNILLSCSEPKTGSHGGQDHGRYMTCMNIYRASDRVVSIQMLHVKLYLKKAK